MTESDWIEIAALVADLWDDARMTPERAAAWYPVLADLDGDVVRASIYALAASNTPWPPRAPGEIRAAAGDLTEVGWEAALADLYEALRRNGRAGGIPEGLDERLVAYVRSCGGWTALCNRKDGWTADPAVRAQFRDYWRDARPRVTRRAAVESATATLGLTGAVAAIGRPMPEIGGPDVDRP